MRQFDRRPIATVVSIAAALLISFVATASAQPTQVGGELPGSTLWSAAGSPYLVDETVIVAADDTLTIEPGVVVKFGTYTRLEINGTLLAEGDVAQRIVFTSYRDDEWGGDTNEDGASTGYRGDWYHLLFEGVGTGSRLSHCLIRFAGRNHSYYRTAIQYHQVGSPLILTDCEIEETYGYSSADSRYTSIYAAAGTTLDLTDCTIDGNYGAGITAYGTLLMHGCSVTGNTTSGVMHGDNGSELTLCTISGNGHRGVYLAGDSCRIDRCTIEGNGDSGLVCGGPDLVVVDSVIEANGDYGIELAGDDGSISNSRIENNVLAGIYATGVTASVVNDTIRYNDAEGLYATAELVAFEDNLITDNETFGCRIQADAVDEIWDLNQYIANGRGNAIAISGGSVTTSCVWVDEYVYAAEASFVVAPEVTLNLEPGVIIKFGDSRYARINGLLIADGTESDPIIFTADRDDSVGGDTNGDGPSEGSPGCWMNLTFEDSDPGCSLSYCRIAYAGERRYISSNRDAYEAIRIIGAGSELTATNTIVTGTAAGSGIYDITVAINLESSARLEMADCRVVANNGQGISGSGTVILHRTEVSDNGDHGVGHAGAQSRITECRFERNGGDGLNTSGDDVYVADVVSKDNNGVGVRLGGDGSIATRAVIENNTGDGIVVDAPGCGVVSSRAEGNHGRGLEVNQAGCVVRADTLRTNGLEGVYCKGAAAEFTDNLVAGNLGLGCHVDASMVERVWTSNDVTANAAANAIGVSGGAVAVSTDWLDEQVYLATGNVTVADEATLTLEPGTIFKFDDDTGLFVEGALVAEGTEGDEIVFTSYRDDGIGGDTNLDGSTVANPGDWRAIKFTNSDAGCSLSYCTIRFAGDSRREGDYYYHEAIWLTGSGSELTMTNSTVEHTNAALGSSWYRNWSVRIDSSTDCDIANCVIRDNEGDAVYSSGSLVLYQTILADNGGRGAFLSGPGTTVTLCEIDRNGSYGVECGSETVTLDQCVLRENGDHAFYAYPGQIGSFIRNNTAEGNAYANSLGIKSGNLTIDDDWGNTYTLVVRGNVSIHATLVIEKGTIMKFAGAYCMTVSGTLLAQGEAVDKIVFTSFKDDNYGGDTNDDGFNSVAAPGDWRNLRFYGSNGTSRLGWAIVSFGGYGNDDAITVDGTDLAFSECIVIRNQDWGVRVTSDGGLSIRNSDIYGNGGGVLNENYGVDVDARNCWWGDVVGPYHPTTNPAGTGDQVSDRVLYDPVLDRSIDNPWIAFTSPTTVGNYLDVAVFDLDGDDFLDLAGSTEESGIHIFSRTGMETWLAEASPVVTGQYQTVCGGDVDGDGHDDIVACGPSGVTCLMNDGDGALVSGPILLAGHEIADLDLTLVDQDIHLDILACSGNNEGLWFIQGHGDGTWGAPQAVTSTQSYNRVRVAFLDDDLHRDIVATSGEFNGIQFWHGGADGTFTPAPTLADGEAFYGLDVADLDRDGHFDLAVGANQTGIGIRIYLNDGAGGWASSPSPISTGIFEDLAMVDLNGDQRPDLLAANHGGGVGAWVSTSSLFWNYWYHPATDYIFRGIDVRDFTLNGSRDLAAASAIHGISLWDNVTPGVFQEYFAMQPDGIQFGEVMLGECAQATFTLTNVSPDTIPNVVVYPSSDVFTVATPVKDVGPLDLLPGESIDIGVSFCPETPGLENEAIIIHSTVALTHIRVGGEGVAYLPPVWSIDLEVSNAAGGEDGSAVLTFGAGVGATDGLDFESGESGLPPLPPSAVFDARFAVDGCEGSLLSIHDLYAERDTFVLDWQVGDGGHPVTVAWDSTAIPQGTFLVEDQMGGVFVPAVDMTTAGRVQIPVEQNFLTGLHIIVNRHSSFEFDLEPGWQLLALPVTSGSSTLEELFPSALSAFTWNGQYEQATELAIGRGYWINSASVDNQIHEGEQVRTVTRTLGPGWSLLGTVFQPIPVGEIQVNPPGSVNSIYGFNGGYYLATTVDPGQGYWVDANQECEITFALPEDKHGSAEASSPRSVAASTDWSLVLTVARADGSSSVQELTFGAADGATQGFDPLLGDALAPPPPPTTVFSARLVGPDAAEYLRDLRASDEIRHEFQVGWRGGDRDEPIYLTWDEIDHAGADRYLLTDLAGGAFLETVDMSLCEEIVIDDPAVAGIRITVEKEDVPVITKYALGQNSPNPFNPQTRIAFTLPEEQHTRMTVHDVAGRTIKVLLDGTCTVGEHEVWWDGTDSGQRRVASGTYFYRIEAGDFRETRKMVLVK